MSFYIISSGTDIVLASRFDKNTFSVGGHWDVGRPNIFSRREFTIRKLAQFEISKFQNSFDLFRIDHFLLNFLFEIRFRLAR